MENKVSCAALLILMSWHIWGCCVVNKNNTLVVVVMFICICLCVLGYFALLAWGQYLEKYKIDSEEKDKTDNSRSSIKFSELIQLIEKSKTKTTQQAGDKTIINEDLPKDVLDKVLGSIDSFIPRQNNEGTPKPP